jgi:hypothetical protein
MKNLSTNQYEPLLARAIKHFWETRNAQFEGGKKKDQGNRGAVTGGKQLDGFLELLIAVSMDMGFQRRVSI